MEKELKKLSEEVCKVIMGESQWSQTMLSNMIDTKEQELIDIKKRQEGVEARLQDISKYLSERKEIYSDLENWSERFDIQDTTAKKTMLINLIDKINVYDDRVTVIYKFKCDYLHRGPKCDKIKEISASSVPVDAFGLLGVLERTQQSRAR